MRPPIQLLFLVALFAAGMPAAAKIAPDDKPLCLPGVCFVSEEARQDYESEKNCIVTHDKCAYSVDRVKRAAKSIPSTDPTYGFYRNQLCIADKSCSNKAQLQNAVWLDNVVFDFIDPLVEERGEWKQLKQKCRSIPVLTPFRDEVCEYFMAQYHIETDLQRSLNQNACGSVSDWNAVGQIIKRCIEDGLSNYWPVFQQAANYLANNVVQNSRDSVRGLCESYRKQRGLPIETQ